MLPHLPVVPAIPKQTLIRLPLYLGYLKSLPVEGPVNISATQIAAALKLNSVQVRKDLACVSSSGKPRVGYLIATLVTELEVFLGYDGLHQAVIVGAGHLGRALLNYSGFKEYGLEVLAAFDIDDSIIGQEDGRILPMSKLQNMIGRLSACIGIITVPGSCAQGVCDQLVSCGIRAIWNFAPVHLIVPDGIMVQNENMAASLASLSRHLGKT